MMKRYNTMCEFWTLKQSHNHVMMGSVDSWFYKALAGIRTTEDAPAFKKIVIKPFPADGLDSVTASIKTVRGKIVSEWHKTENGLLLHIEIPFNTKATVYVPKSRGRTIYAGNKKATEADGIRFIKTENDNTMLKITSGKYDIEVR